MAGLEELEAERASLSQRPELQDLQPILLDEGKAVALQYTARQLEVYAYFRAVQAAGETGQRALGLTAEVSSVCGRRNRLSALFDASACSQHFLAPWACIALAPCNTTPHKIEPRLR